MAYYAGLNVVFHISENYLAILAMMFCIMNLTSPMTKWDHAPFFNVATTSEEERKFWENGLLWLGKFKLEHNQFYDYFKGGYTECYVNWFVRINKKSDSLNKGVAFNREGRKNTSHNNY